MIEAIIAMALLGLISAVAFTGDSGQLRHVAQSIAETKARHLAAARLATLEATPEGIEVGDREIVLAPEQVRGLPAAQGRELARMVEPGLIEIEVTVSWLPPGARQRREVRLTTWLEREGR
jgi:hypothetical protein